MLGQEVVESDVTEAACRSDASRFGQSSGIDQPRVSQASQPRAQLGEGPDPRSSRDIVVQSRQEDDLILGSEVQQT